MATNANTQAVLDFAKAHSCDADWVARMIELDRVPAVLKAGQRGTYSGFDCVVTGHYCNGMWNVSLPGGPACISGADFIPN